MRRDAKGEPFCKYAKFICRRPETRKKDASRYLQRMMSHYRKKSSLDPSKFFAYLVAEQSIV